MKFGIIYDISYNITTNGVVAICKAELSKKTVNYLYRILDNTTVFDIRVETKGIARLNPEDKYDLELAKEVAKKKAIRTAYLEIKNKLTKHLFDVQEYYTSVLDSIIQAHHKAIQIDEEIMDMVSKDE